MEIKINIEKKYFFVLLFVLLVIGGILIVKAFGTNRPQDFGHSFSEIVDDVSGGRIYGSSKSNGGKQLIVTVNEGEGGANDEVWIGPNTVSADGIIVLSAITTDIAKNVKIGGRLDVTGNGIIRGRLGVGTSNPSSTLDVDGDVKVRGRLHLNGAIDIYKCPSIPGERTCGISSCTGQLVTGSSQICSYSTFSPHAGCGFASAICNIPVGKIIPV